MLRSSRSSVPAIVAFQSKGVTSFAVPERLPLNPLWSKHVQGYLIRDLDEEISLASGLVA